MGVAVDYYDDITDFDNDGQLDAVVSNVNGPARLFHNVTPNTWHWLAVKLIGTRSNRVASEQGSRLPSRAAVSSTTIAP